MFNGLYIEPVGKFASDKAHVRDSLRLVIHALEAAEVIDVISKHSGWRVPF